MKPKYFVISTVLLGLGLLLAPVQPVHADIATCPGDYYGFILKARSAATRKQTFSDFFRLGYCQLNDIIQLEDELDTLREDFRNAADACEDTSDYKKQYNEVLMEEYFVRNIQKSKSDVINEVDEEKLKALKETKLEALKKEMETLFVDQESRVDENTFDSYFEDWSSKYDDRIADYAHCEEGSWAELQDTWKKFVDDINSINIDVKKTEWDIDSEVSVDSEDAKKDMSTVGKTFQNAYEYLTAKKEQRQAEVPSPSTAKDLSQSGDTLSFEEALDVLNSSDHGFSIQTNAADRMATYEILYGAGGAVAATDMQSILIYMNTVLSETNTKDFPSITKSAGQVYDKQCQ